MERNGLSTLGLRIGMRMERSGLSTLACEEGCKWYEMDFVPLALDDEGVDGTKWT